jgi:hypothetical protein
VQTINRRPPDLQDGPVLLAEVVKDLALRANVAAPTGKPGKEFLPADVTAVMPHCLQAIVELSAAQKGRWEDAARPSDIAACLQADRGRGLVDQGDEARERLGRLVREMMKDREEPERREWETKALRTSRLPGQSGRPNSANWRGSLPAAGLSSSGQASSTQLHIRWGV